MEFNLSSVLLIGLLVAIVAMMFRRGGGCCGHSHSEDNKGMDKHSNHKSGSCH